jgi:hypothetical protein
MNAGPGLDSDKAWTSPTCCWRQQSPLQLPYCRSVALICACRSSCRGILNQGRQLRLPTAAAAAAVRMTLRSRLRTRLRRRSLAPAAVGLWACSFAATPALATSTVRGPIPTAPALVPAVLKAPAPSVPAPAWTLDPAGPAPVAPVRSPAALITALPTAPVVRLKEIPLSGPAHE